MPTPYEIKDTELIETPVLLFDCTLANGAAERWSTHQVSFGGGAYAARVLDHNVFDLRSGAEDGIDMVSKVSLTLANANSYFSQLEQSAGLKGARLEVRFVFFNLLTGQPASDAVTLFRGLASAPEELTESLCRLSFANRLSPQRVLMPNVRIQKRCPWIFPSTAEQRLEGITGLDRGKYSPFFRCGYSADQSEGVGNLDAGGQPYTSCSYTRAACEQRGMFNQDSRNQSTARFGGMGFVPASILVRGAGEGGLRVSDPVENEARYNDFVPMIYGTAWYQPPLVFARNDGNLTRMEVLLGLGEIEGVLKVIVNGIEIPVGQSGMNMAGTGWYNVVNRGTRNGGFNLDFTNGAGQPVGDPYGSLAYASVVVPNRVSDGKRLPSIQVLAQGLRVSRFDAEGGYLDEAFTANPAWVLLDLLRRAGWEINELDAASFASAAAYCEETVSTFDIHGNPVDIARYLTNVVMRKRRSAAEMIRGIRNAAGLALSYGPGGRLRIQPESKIALTHPVKPAGSNATQQLFGGWPAYEFGPGSILRRESGAPAIRFWSRSNADSPNRFTLEFQDAFNEYQQDSLSIVDVEDATRVGQEIAASYHALGTANFDQAARILRQQLDKSLRGNRYVEFETSVKALGIRPGDLITLSYPKEGYTRQLFRVLRVQPKTNYATVTLTAQIHDENWYLQPGLAGGGNRRQANAGLGVPRPLVGAELDAGGEQRFGITELVRETSDGRSELALRVEFQPPAKPQATAAGIPIVDLTPDVFTTGGSIQGGQSLYYAVAALDADGRESKLSFVVRAPISAGTNTNRVQLKGLSFSSSTASFAVYRGPNPQQLLRLANAVPLAATFTDTGAAPGLVGPPDEDFATANFYWRLEVQPEIVANQFSPSTIGNSALNMATGSMEGLPVRITRGRGRGQERTILTNSPTAVAVTPAWDITPDATSYFVIAEAGWKYAAGSATSPVEFEVPNREGETVQVLGLAANVNGQESPAELAPLTRWQLGGAGAGGGSGPDNGLPPEPGYAFRLLGDGSVELTAVGFPTLQNTRGIMGGTLTLHYWNELNASPALALDAAILDTVATTLVLNEAAAGLTPDAILQVDQELMRVTAISPDGLTLTVERGALESNAAAHPAAVKVYRLERGIFVAPFVKGFFGSPASLKYSFPVYLPDARIAASEFFVTNSYGDGSTTAFALTQNTAAGMRTGSGGQLTLQFDGPLAIGSNLTPALIAERAQSILAVTALVADPPTGGQVEVRVLRNGETYADLVIPENATAAMPVTGFGKAPLLEGDRITIDILNVPPSDFGTPGRDLTVALRR
jgi:hypothetical protein